MSALTEQELQETLAKIPLSIEIRHGHDLSLVARVLEDPAEAPVLEVED